MSRVTKYFWNQKLQISKIEDSPLKNQADGQPSHEEQGRTLWNMKEGSNLHLYRKFSKIC